MSGLVTVAGERSDKPGAMVSSNALVELSGSQPYVSRGGQKLASVVDELSLDFEGKTIIDVGASTGGFSDFALKHGAAKVITVDVGTGQLDWGLRNNPKVEVHEQADIRSFVIGDPADMALVDVSFVSVLKVIESVASQVKPGGQIIVMVKPQFEAEPAVASKFKGVISDEAVRQSILDRVRDRLAQDFDIRGEADSAVLGPKGNRERFFSLTKR